MNFRAPLFLILLVAGLAVAGNPDQMVPKSPETLRLHEKAENLYRDGHLGRARFIYVNELAAIGDKYAQYMAGYMSLTGKGTERDVIEASAWYRLAAERGTPEFAAVRDKLLMAMNETDLQASDAAYLELRQQCSDLVLILRYLREERKALKSLPKRYTPSGSTNMINDPATGLMVDRKEYAKRLMSQMQSRVDFVTSMLGIDDVDADMNDDEFEALAAKVDEYLQVVNDR